MLINSIVKVETQMEIYAVNIHDPIPNQKNFEHLIKALFPHKENEIRKYKKVGDQRRKLYGELLLKYILSKKVNIKMNKILFSKNDYGKPLYKENKGIHFNLSHSGDWCVCAFSQFPIGIDIEQMEPLDIQWTEHFFHPDEIQRLKQLPEHQQREYFYKLWTMKESYLKAIGCGLSQWSKELTETYIGEQTSSYQHFIFNENYMISICEL